MSKGSEGIELRELIGEVSDQLRQASSDLGDKDPTLQLENVELEISVGVATQGKAGIRLWVIELGGDVSAEQVHRVKATFAKHSEFSGTARTIDDSGG